MVRIVRISLVCLSATILLVAPVAATAGAGSPIKAGQHFLGLVNGSHKGVVVTTVCPGPAGPKRTGPVAGGQTMSVRHVRHGNGYTGLFDSVYAWFRPAAGGPKPTQLHFKTYGTTKAIPTSIVVPCGGSGAVVFSSCPYLAPCAAGWVTDVVKVTFENIAV
jgi:hypothetical protein